MRRIKNAMIPAEFERAEFTTYKVQNDTQKLMFDAIQAYLNAFTEIRNEPHNSLGFIAKYGEQRLREIRSAEKRAEVKRLHNNFGLGKTHLQVATAKALIHQGYTVVVVSDVSFMEELMNAKKIDDEGEEYNRIMHSLSQADVLVWDDIGKAKPSESRLNAYYRIVDDRYRNKKPILFSSNEDAGTLSERIGDAAASRLFGMAKGRIYAVEGPDYRLQAN